jgi:hypothetical protein
MPDESGKLSTEDKEKVEAWLKKKWRAPVTCPVSQDNNWIIGDHVVTPVNWATKGLIVGGRVYPQVMLICKTCGHTLLFNAMVMELFPPQKGASDGQK